jgi:hypothetical protein
MMTETVRAKFAHGRARQVLVGVRKPTKPAASLPAMDMGARLLARARKERDDRFKIVHDPASRFPAVEGPTTTLSKGRERAALRPHGLCLVVRGCGPVPTRMPKRKPVIVEMDALNGQYRLTCRGITCDGEMTLPAKTTLVRFTLIDLEAAVSVTVAGRPDGSRKKKEPKRWITRRLVRPNAGKYRRPKPAV